MKFAVIGNYGTGNIGDEAILSGLTFALKEKYPECEVIVIGKGRLLPLGFRSFFRSIVQPSLWKTPLSLIKSTDSVILGGGGLFSDEESPFTAIFWALHGIISAKFLKKPVACIGISVGKVSWISKLFLKWLFKLSRLVMVRDQGTNALLSSWGVKSTLGSDLAFLIPSTCEKGLLHGENKYVFISIRRYKNIDGNMYKIFVQLCDYINRKYGLNIVLIPFKYGVENDNEILSKILDQVEDKSKVEIMTDCEDFDRVLEVIRKAEFGIGMRLHAGIFSLIAETPFLPISYSDKISDFWRDSSVAALKIKNLTVKSLIESFDEMYEKREMIKNEMKTLKNLKVEEIRQSLQSL